MDVLQPCIGMRQAVALLFVPDIPLTEKKNSKKEFTTYFTLNQILYDLQFKLYTLTKNVMSGMN